MITVENDMVHHRMLCDALADSIRDRLFGHEFAPRHPLDEAALAAHYRVGRLPLTEALRQLVRERLLTRERDGYFVHEYCRADIETILDMLEHLRLFMMCRAAPTRLGTIPETRASISASSYWGVAGFVVALPFAVAAQSLYNQLRVATGPELAAIETRCAQAMTVGETVPIASFCNATARTFRQQVLSAFDEACSRRGGQKTECIATAPCQTTLSPFQPLLEYAS
ncbi:MAG: GntR family transcriptional regulator [Azoarcus sp.]|nr:GntR family transcriptional regulator [Azoarcus sp.]